MSHHFYHDTRNRSPEGISPVLGVCVRLKREEKERERGAQAKYRVPR
jgi:hypothetical protein